MPNTRQPRRIRPGLACALLSALPSAAALALDLLSPWQAALAHGLVLSLLTGALYAFDKRRARRQGPRVREVTLLGLAFAGGALGAWIAMRTLRHKTRQRRFTWSVPLALAGHVALLVWLAWR